MIPCPRCGALNLDSAVKCHACEYQPFYLIQGSAIPGLAKPPDAADFAEMRQAINEAWRKLNDPKPDFVVDYSAMKQGDRYIDKDGNEVELT